MVIFIFDPPGGLWWRPQTVMEKSHSKLKSQLSSILNITMLKINVNSEVSVLKAVLLGSVRNFYIHPPINSTQKHYYTSNPPILDKLISQQNAFAETLLRNGVEIYWATQQEFSPLQINTRDVACVISNTLVICSMKEEIRKREPDSIFEILEVIDGAHIRVDTGIVEGGDVILDNKTIYVGLSERTNAAGLEWIRSRFGGNFEVIGIKLLPPFLHLDVVFNLVGLKSALIYPKGIEDSSVDTLRKRYELLPVNDDEQFGLATNLFSISPETVISDKRHWRVNQEIRAKNIEVLELDFSEITKIGGSFRCSTCPLLRE